ncbi:MAG: ParM/StbA family protein [Ectothiorhodospiraceae bacterium]|jgi:plasmid segregation protein ParM|nr:ParM/StbA family protein [Ectothiorhodospiraceae bacterium]
MGIDIGYGSMKVVDGEIAIGRREMVLPVGAAPATHLGVRVGAKAYDVVRVLVNGTEYVATVQPERLGRWKRVVHADYPSSDSYRALYYAALSLAGRETIDRVVTGLPTSQWLVAEIRNRLQEMMIGVHEIRDGVLVEVKDVIVVPQPVGGFVDYSTNNESAHQMRILVVDPGFYSTDWILIQDVEIDVSSSGTSTLGMSFALEGVAKEIAAEYGIDIGRERLEHALRIGSSTVRAGQHQVEHYPYMARAAQCIAEQVAVEIQSSLRAMTVSPDIVLVVGGGARWYADHLSTVFGGIDVVTPPNTVLANARGFWDLGKEA